MDAKATTLKDDPARRAAIADHGNSILVEAGAGSGKTAVMAGRIAMMLAGNIEPKSIGAVTFTELAASELFLRVRDFVAELLAGKVPTELEICLPDGLSETQRASLEAASESIDEVACTTIHGFCQRLIKPYPVEADIDPGAKVVDRTEGDLLFDETVDGWLRERLSHDEGSLLSELVVHDADQTVDAVREILDLMRKHRSLKARPGSPLAIRLGAYRSAADSFCRFLAGAKVQESETVQIAEHFRTHVDELPASADAAADMARILTSSPDSSLFTATTGAFGAYRRKGKWEAGAKAVGVSKAEAGLLNDAAAVHYAACCDAWNALIASVGAHVLAGLVDEARPAIGLFQNRKRAIGLLDFDDLVHAARDLLRDHDKVRRALAMRYAHILVDEFQDTDPIQAEIFWRLCGDPAPDADTADWRKFVIRPGALFLVGDPKQAIYRFRGADVAAYTGARETFVVADAKCVISTNFRSRPQILEYVNARFEAPLSAPEQPGFTALDSFHLDGDDPCGAVALDVFVGEPGAKPPNAEARRDAEAEAVAEACARMIGEYPVADHKSKTTRPCRPGDIALLAPTGTELWRYEAALEARGIPVATQAGKGFYRRQEIQDLIALTRVLADGRDTLALGALLRGPVVGMTDEQLLDIILDAPRSPEASESLPALSLSIEAGSIKNPFARETIEKLGYLRSRANSTTPHDLISQAIDFLRVRPLLVARHPRQAERALSNVDRYVSLATPYSVRGLRAFAEAMTAAWSAAAKEGGRAPEGRPDAQEEAVSLYTMHSSKGLEWPIVIPINTMGPPKKATPAVVDRNTGELFMSVFDVSPAGFDLASINEKAEIERERIRLWYVATTRARELLVLPRPNIEAPKNAWSGLVDLGLGDLPSLDISLWSPDVLRSVAGPSNEQTREQFAAEAERIVSSHSSLKWRAPSRDEGPSTASDVGPTVEMPNEDAEATGSDSTSVVQGGLARGLVIHKLFEEILNGETTEEADALSKRAAELIRQLGKDVAVDPASGLVPTEIAACVRKALKLPEIIELLPTLVPELPVFASTMVDGTEMATAGVADAVSYDGNGKAKVVVDWKSDVEPASNAIERYSSQVRDYLDTTGAERGLIVFVTTGKVVTVSKSR